MGRHKSYDRKDVLRRAQKLFWDKGYEGTHLRELIEFTGINRFSLYAEFGGKQGLFQEALESYLVELETVVSRLDGEPPGFAKVEAFLKAVVEFPFSHGCFAMNTIREKPVVTNRAFRKVTDLVRRVESGLERNLRAAKARGELGIDVDPADLARFLVAVDIGALSYGILSRNAAGSRSDIFGIARAVLGAPRTTPAVPSGG